MSVAQIIADVVDEKEEQQRAEEMREHAQRLTGIENSLLETRSAVDDIKQQLTNTISKSINELEERHQQDEMRHSEQAKTFADLLTGAEQQIGDLRRSVADDHERLGELKAVYWGNREKDERRRDERI